MPIEAERIIPGLYYENWVGNITEDEVYKSAQTRSRWARDDEAAYYVIIMDATAVKRLPPVSSLASAGKAHPNGKMRFMVVNLPRIHTFAVGIIGRFLPNPMEIYSDRETAITAAKAVLKAQQNDSS